VMFLRWGGQAGEQCGGGVDEQVVIDVGDPAGAGELEGQQGQQGQLTAGMARVPG
jgi:hypothetical protein